MKIKCDYFSRNKFINSFVKSVYVNQQSQIMIDSDIFSLIYFLHSIEKI